jgi:hypothetical protein
VTSISAANPAVYRPHRARLVDRQFGRVQRARRQQPAAAKPPVQDHGDGAQTFFHRWTPSPARQSTARRSAPSCPATSPGCSRLRPPTFPARGRACDRCRPRREPCCSTAPSRKCCRSPPSRRTQFATFTYGASDFIDGPISIRSRARIVTSYALNGVVTLTFSFSAYDSTRPITSAISSPRSASAIKVAHGAQPVGNTPAPTPPTGPRSMAARRSMAGQGFRELRHRPPDPASIRAAAVGSGRHLCARRCRGLRRRQWRVFVLDRDRRHRRQHPARHVDAMGATGALWTWAQIVSVSGSGLIGPIGTLTNGGGLAAAFDGNTSKTFASSAGFSLDITTYPLWIATAWTVGQLVQYAGVGYQALISASLPVRPRRHGLPDRMQRETKSLISGLCTRLPCRSSAGATPPTDARWTRVAGLLSTDPPPFAVVGDMGVCRRAVAADL